MHGPRLVSLPVADWLAQTQLNSTTSPTAPTAPCTASTASTAPIDAPNAPGLPDYRTAHRSSSSELGELESEQREIELRVASLSADSRGGRRRVVGPPQGKSIIACAIGLCICASTTRVLRHSPRTLSPCRPSCRPSPLTPRCSSLSPPRHRFSAALSWLSRLLLRATEAWGWLWALWIPGSQRMLMQ